MKGASEPKLQLEWYVRAESIETMSCSWMRSDIICREREVGNIAANYYLQVVVDDPHVSCPSE